MSQTSYSQNMATGFAGMVVDSGLTRVVSYAAEETIEFGYAVVFGTDGANEVRLPDADTDILAGIALHEHNEDTKYLTGQTVNVCRRGVVWVQVAAAVAVNAVAYVVATTGKFTSSSSGNIAVGGRFLSATSGAGIAKVEINLP